MDMIGVLPHALALNSVSGAWSTLSSKSSSATHGETASFMFLLSVTGVSLGFTTFTGIHLSPLIESTVRPNMLFFLYD